MRCIEDAVEGWGSVNNIALDSLPEARYQSKISLVKLQEV